MTCVLCGDPGTHDCAAPHCTIVVCDGCDDRTYHQPAAPGRG